jgi:hypothetical protein
VFPSTWPLARPRDIYMQVGAGRLLKELIVTRRPDRPLLPSLPSVLTRCLCVCVCVRVVCSMLPRCAVSLSLDVAPMVRRCAMSMPLSNHAEGPKKNQLRGSASRPPFITTTNNLLRPRGSLNLGFTTDSLYFLSTSLAFVTFHYSIVTCSASSLLACRRPYRDSSFR